MNFETSIITNSKYIKYRKLRGPIFVALVFFGTPALFMSGRSSSNRSSLIEDMKEFPLLKYYYIALIILGCIYAVIHYYSWHIKKLGKLKLTSTKLEINTDDYSNTITFADIKKLKLIRNSTYHKDDDLGKPYSGNNWIEIHSKGNTVQKYEFQISSKDHNKEFEDVVKNLNRILGHKLSYKSI